MTSPRFSNDTVIFYWTKGGGEIVHSTICLLQRYVISVLSQSSVAASAIAAGQKRDSEGCQSAVERSEPPKMVRRKDWPEFSGNRIELLKMLSVLAGRTACDGIFDLAHGNCNVSAAPTRATRRFSPWAHGLLVVASRFVAKGERTLNGAPLAYSGVKRIRYRSFVRYFSKPTE
jgi:hypothetical protein